MRAAAACAFLVAACSPPTPQAGPVTHVEVTAAEGFRMTHTVRSDDRVLRQVDLHVDPGVDYGYRTGTYSISVSATGDEVTDASTSTGLRIHGQEVEVGVDRLMVGDRELGPLSDGSKVEFRADGVFVDGELRGTLEP